METLMTGKFEFSPRWVAALTAIAFCSGGLVERGSWGPCNIGRFIHDPTTSSPTEVHGPGPWYAPERFVDVPEKFVPAEPYTEPKATGGDLYGRRTIYYDNPPATENPAKQAPPARNK